MKQVNVKKLILPNIPYVFIALLATKVSEAVRLAPGSDASTKLLNIMTGLNTAFHSLVPSFHPIDLCVGVAAAIAIRLAVYIKGKNAKKFRKNLEYGSARWGTAEDIKPYVDPAFENNIILTQTERLTMNSRPKDPKTARNKNVLIVGGSGSGKTRFWLKPNLLQCTSKTYPTSFVVTDPKGDIVVSCGHALQKNGYQIKMLKITSDGRKLGLDQRIINPMLPDEETTKVNQCVANILQYWRDGEEEKLTQLVFCDISTPKTTPSQRAAKASPGTLDSPEIHALESAISLEESSDTPFTVYEDVRQKLIDAGMPPEQIAFIHDANTEVKKRELFAKVRSGQVRVLMGSTAKMGAGTNVQDRLVALHDLDCPWRPRDLTQRKGRIERQGNQNKLVHVCRYVTEGTFDAYLWQTVENKQKFISQIMTSKSPVRSCEDVDATALSFAEIKALCAGDPRIKERMDLDIEVSKLKIMKADHNSKQFRLEDSLLKYFPEKIEEHKGFVRGLEADMQTLAAHPLPAEGFVGMEIRGDRLTDKENAGAALLDTCKEVKGKDPVQIGSYRGFTMSVAFDSMWKTYTLTLKGQMTHRVELGSDARGNLVRIENALDKMPERLRSVQEQLENLYNQQAAAKAEVGKPFPQEQELAAKTARLIELDMELNLDGKGQPQPEQAIAKSTRPSVLDRLKAPPVHGAPEKPHKKEMEAR